MKLIKKILPGIALGTAALLSISSQAAELIIDGSGKLVGANEVMVDGALYNVQLVDGTCIDLYQGCDNINNFVFDTQAKAVAASQALFDQVLINLPAPNTFDDDPEKLQGCTNSGICRVMTPYGFSLDLTQVLGATADNNQFEIDDVITPNIAVADSTDFAGISLATYAVWLPLAVTVPIPGAIALLPMLLLIGHLAKARSTA